MTDTALKCPCGNISTKEGLACLDDQALHDSLPYLKAGPTGASIWLCEKCTMNASFHELQRRGRLEILAIEMLKRGMTSLVIPDGSGLHLGAVVELKQDDPES